MKPRLPRWLLWCVAVIAVAGFAALGRWQYARALEKQALLEANARVLAERDPRPLRTEAARDATALAWSAGEGRFLDAPALLLDNQLQGGVGGVRAYRAFMPEGASRAVLVDLGWFAVPQRTRMPRPARPEGEVRVRGLLATPPAPGIAMGVAVQALDEGRLLAMRMDMPAISEGLGVALAPRVLRLDPDLDVAGLDTGRRDLEVLANTLPPERHRGYALQWFGLALATAVAALVVGLRRPSR
ncbi:SURF1 family protein [Coralloluteibacterium stylophorae]|uniref:SURF1 family protein n=1 Tax=Coralloluteibacterium stylophorae TaxID=1776034 RepID=UPI0030844187